MCRDHKKSGNQLVQNTKNRFKKKIASNIIFINTSKNYIQISLANTTSTTNLKDICMKK